MQRGNWPLLSHVEGCRRVQGRKRGEWDRRGWEEMGGFEFAPILPTSLAALAGGAILARSLTLATSLQPLSLPFAALAAALLLPLRPTHEGPTLLLGQEVHDARLGLGGR